MPGRALPFSGRTGAYCGRPPATVSLLGHLCRTGPSMKADTVPFASPTGLQALVDSCRQALRHIDPNRVRVAAAVLSREGRIFTAVQVRSRNCSHCSVCAEAVAIGMAFTARAFDLVAAAAVMRDDDRIAIASPCGGCRELLRDHGVDQVVVSQAEDGTLITARPTDLLPWP
ncbi:hypothetical protein ACIRPT_38645 [Streptomyces sp. NPDC101227]|uniref:hypothetical protein n=1 Tax=Streptomyces sp. NPDC101227 TaxID=3366136 RepID=UPI0038244A33